MILLNPQNDLTVTKLGYHYTVFSLLLIQVTSQRNEEFTVTRLMEGDSYNFRVAAENEVRVGEFAELPKSVVPKSQHGTNV